MKRFKAFTLIELLIVITIIGILAVALVPRISQGPARARDVQRKADLQQISTALEMYYADHGEYANSDSGLPEEICGADLDSYLGSYLDVPADPSSGSPMVCTNDYYYKVMPYTDGGSTPSAYALVAHMEIVPGDSANYFCNDTIPGGVDNMEIFSNFVENESCDGSEDNAYYTIYH